MKSLVQALFFQIVKTEYSASLEKKKTVTFLCKTWLEKASSASHIFKLVDNLHLEHTLIFSLSCLKSNKQLPLWSVWTL